MPNFTILASAFEQRAVLAASLAQGQPVARTRHSRVRKNVTRVRPSMARRPYYHAHPPGQPGGSQLQGDRMRRDPSRVFAWPGFRMAEFSHGRVFAWPSFRMDGHKMVTTQSIRVDMDHDGTGVRTHNNGGFPDDAARSETDQYGLNGISRPPRSTTPAARRRERRSRFRRASRVCRSSPSRAVPSPMVLDVNRPVDKGSGALRVRVW